MRERAQDAKATEVWDWRSKNSARANYWPEETRVGRYVQSWHPAVALAVADWLDEVGPSDDDATAALLVARTYLGEDA